jgi:hypothetical protein
MRANRQTKAVVIAKTAKQDRIWFWAAVALITAAMAIFSGKAQAAPEGFDFYSGEVTTPVDHSAFGDFLGKYVRDGDDEVNLVAYGEVTTEDKKALSAYIDGLETVNPTQLTEDEAFAYWVNLYNAVTLEVVLENYPVASIRDIRSGLRAGPWKRKLVNVNNQDLSLDDIEHGILRKFWNEQRIHYAVNCASIGCPNLAKKPYTGAQLQDQLEAAAYNYVNTPRGVQFRDDGKLILSSIYKWYRGDFGKTDTQVIAQIRRYADDELRVKLTETGKISGYYYDWALNDAK